MKTRAPITVLLVVLPLLGLAAGVIVGASYTMKQAGPQDKAPAEVVCNCNYEPGLVNAFEELKAKTDATRQELNSIRLQTAEIYNLVETRPGSTASSPVRNALPAPYVYQVDTFFETSNALDLLASDVRNASDLKFGRPRFVSFKTITVPYTTGGREDYLIVTIDILDYYDLKFKVVWDSREGG